MKENVFELSSEELKKVGNALQDRIEEGLRKDGMEISDIPTHINPKKDIRDGRVLVLDWGGTNFRAAVVEFKQGKPTVLEVVKKPLSARETQGFTRDDLFEAMASYISQLKTLDEQVTQIGYCFSYAAASRLNGDAILLRWTKGIDVTDMINNPVGEPLLKYLNNHKDVKPTFTDIKVINDTVACLFAGLSNTGYDNYIGLIVGTGTNMACLMPLNKIEKLNSKGSDLIPVNLESGNFKPPYLTVIDHLVDSISNNKGHQVFEKAISGGYLGEIFKTAFMCEKIKYDFDGGELAKMINNPQDHPEDQVKVARWIYERSAKLVAASIVGLVQVLASQDSSVKRICLLADGSVFWGKDKSGKPAYKDLVEKELQLLLPPGVTVTIADEVGDPNLVGSGIAALS